MAERNALDRNLTELEGRARAAADWRTHHRNHPEVSMGLAFGAGLALGLLVLPEASDDDGWDGDVWHGGDGHAAMPEHGADQGDSRVSQAAHAVSSASSRAASSARAGLSAVGRSEPVSRAKHQAADTLGRMADALLALASAKAIEFVAGKVPGFAEEIERQELRDHQGYAPRAGV